MNKNVFEMYAFTYIMICILSYIPSTNKTDRHGITEILLKVALNTITLTRLYTDKILSKWEYLTLLFTMYNVAIPI